MIESQNVRERGERFETPVQEEVVCSQSAGQGRVYSSTALQCSAPRLSHTLSALPSHYAAYHAVAPTKTHTAPHTSGLDE